MNNKKLRFTVLSILVLVMVCLAAFTGCRDKKNNGGDSNASSTEIYIEKSLQPRLLYVEGQDFDFSTGAVTVSKGDEKTRVPFSDSRVTVTGYDKYTLGNQTLTVSFEGKTTTLTVAVIARMTVENVETEYFVGEKFNKTKGRVKVAKDDGSTSYVDMKNDSITVKSFNSSTAGSTNVTIQYANGGATYECSFSVNVYAPAKIDFKQPNKKDYMSHEKELNFAGGYLYLEAAKPSTFKKSINITNDMVVGYDPDSVTVANKDTAVAQTIKVSYAGKEWFYDVNVLYSPIYVIESLADKIANVNLELSEGQTIADIKLPAGAGIAAKEAMQRYFMLSSADQSKLDSELMLDFARVAAFYVNTNDYVNAVNDLSDAFILTADGQLTYPGKTYEAVVKAIDALNDPKSAYNASAALMLQIKDAFGEETLTGNYKISQLTSPHTEEVALSIADKLQHVITIYDLLKNIPSTWKTDLLNNTAAFTSNYGADILSAVFTISSSEYTGSRYSGLYAVITGWRSDFFEIIYSYYYYAKDGGKDQLTTDLWGKVPAPGILEDFYTTFNRAYEIGSQLTTQYQQSPGSVNGTDLFVFHYYYRKALDFSKQVKASGNELYTTLYNAINLDAYINVYLNAPSSKLLGYYDFIGPVLDNSNVALAHDAYFAILDVYATTGEVASNNENRTKILNLFNSMVNLSPSELHWFLSSVCFNYHNVAGAVLIFDFQNPSNWIAQLMYGFFFQELPKNSDGTLHNAQAAFANLIQAMETYPTAQFNEDAIEDFKSYMKLVNEQFNELTATEKTAFRNLAGNLLDKCNKYYNAVLDQTTVTLSTEMKAKFDELYGILDKFNNIVNDSDKTKLAAAYPALMGLYSKATVLYNEICDAAKANSSVAHALNAYLYEITLDDEEIPTVLKFTLDSYYNYIKYVSYTTMVPNGHLDYVNSLSDTLIQLLPLYEAELNGTVYDNINAMIAIVRALDDEKLSAFYSINGSIAYFDAIKRYADATFPDQNALNAGAMTDKIDSILALYKEFEELYTIVLNSTKYNETQRTIACTAMIAIYNKAKLVYDEILEAAGSDANIMNAINFKFFSVTVTEGGDPIEGLLDDYVNYMKLTTNSLLSSGEDLMNAAKVESVKALLIKLIPLLKAEATGTAYTGTDILDLLVELRNLNPADKYAFYVLQGNLALYAELERYLEAQLSEAGKTSEIVSYLFNAEIYYSLYELDNEDSASLETFKTAMENAITAYASLTEADKAVLDTLYYEQLLAKYNALFPAA